MNKQKKLKGFSSLASYCILQIKRNEERNSDVPAIEESKNILVVSPSVFYVKIIFFYAKETKRYGKFSVILSNL